MIIWVVTIGGLVIIILLIVGVVVSATSERSVMEQRLGQYLGGGDTNEADQKATRGALTEWVSRRVEKTTYGDKVARDLARADLKIKVAEYFILIALSICLFGLMIWFIGGRSWLSALMGVGLGLFLPGWYVKQQQKKRLKKFDDQLSDMLNLTVNGLRAGYSTMQAMESVSKELPSPICDEFRRVVQEMQIGISMETALANLLRRIPSVDLDFVVTAINVQREVGGNLSEILDTISFTIRERVRIKGEIQVMTAQVRTSGQILSLIPFGLVLVLYFLNRPYLMTIIDAGIVCSSIIIGSTIILIGLGYFVMMKIADIEV